MKKLNKDKIEKAGCVTKEELLELVKSHDPKRYDQVLVNSEERKNYYFGKYRSTSMNREVKRLDFPIHDRWKSRFEQSAKTSGDVQVFEDKSLIEDVIADGYVEEKAVGYSGKLIFGGLKVAVDGGNILLNQPLYYIPEAVHRQTCGTCKGDKYTTCKEPECRGQHIYDCNQCHTRGEVDCDKCGARGEYRCPNCGGKGDVVCGRCRGSGREKDKDGFFTRCTFCAGRGRVTCSNSVMRDGLLGAAVKASVGKEKCNGKGIISCSACNAKGKITCSKCSGQGRVECNVCYSDNQEGRYGKVDCETCETAGELGSITYIETEIRKDSFDLVATDGRPIESDDFEDEKIASFVNVNGNLELTYKDLNGETFEGYEEDSAFVSEKALGQTRALKDDYPKLLEEEVYAELTPCATFNYTHILSGKPHEVSVLSIDSGKEVFYHSDPVVSSLNEETLLDKIKNEFAKAFSTKGYKDKIDRKNEFALMVHMAKADGIIEDEEKRFLVKNITGLDGFTKAEKAELFAMMSEDVLPEITPERAYFSSRERGESVKTKLVELIAKADGEYEPVEKAKLDEISKAMELGYNLNPYGLKAFFRTWTVSVPLITIPVFAVLVGIYFYFAPAASSTETDFYDIEVTSTDEEKRKMASEESVGKPDEQEGEQIADVIESEKPFLFLEGSDSIMGDVVYRSLLNLTVDTSVLGSDVLTSEELRICRNAIFAKYGYVFKSADLYDYFSDFVWYYPDSTLDESMIVLTEEEEQYVETIKLLEEAGASKLGDKELFQINDPDGFTNLRDEPSGKIIRKVLDNETFQIVGESGNWKEILLPDGTTGFMHKSRIVESKEDATDSVRKSSGWN